jgi:nucleoside-diphosphate-sugar epimerase
MVTGSAGFLGRHFCAELVHRHATVERVDVEEMGPVDARSINGYGGFDLVIHCAAVVGGRAVIDGHPLAVAETLEIDAAVIRWAERARPGCFVYVSSSAAYPVALQEGRPPMRLREEAIDLDTPRRPDAIYGWVKLTGELLCRQLAATGVRTLVVRPFSGYGGGQSTDYPFGAFTERARRHEDPFTIWGDGEQVRDWIHVSDIVGAVLAAVDERVDGPLNVGCGVPVSMNQLADLVCQSAGYSPAWRYLGTEPAGVRYRVCDPLRMLEVYRPTVSLEAGVAGAMRPLGRRR